MLSSSLTDARIRGYAGYALAKSSAGISTPQQRASRRSLDSAFFTPVVYGGLIQGVSARRFSLCGSTNLSKPATLRLVPNGGGSQNYKEEATMPNLSIFSREIRQYGALYSLNDLHKASGSEKRHKPNYFSSLDQTNELIDEIVQGRDSGLALKTIHGGRDRGTYACKELVYAYAMWVSPKFHLSVIRAFDAVQNQAMPTLVDQPLPDELQRMVNEHIAMYTGEAHELIKKQLMTSACEALSRGPDADPMELFSLWCGHSKAMLLTESDVNLVLGLAKVLQGKLADFESVFKRLEG